MDSKKEIVFFSSFMRRIICPLFFPYKRRCGSPVVSVSNIGKRYFFGKQIFYEFVCFRFLYYPEMVAKTIICYKIILWFLSAYYFVDDIINIFYGRICKKNRFNI